MAHVPASQASLMKKHPVEHPADLAVAVAEEVIMEHYRRITSGMTAHAAGYQLRIRERDQARRERDQARRERDKAYAQITKLEQRVSELEQRLLRFGISPDNDDDDEGEQHEAPTLASTSCSPIRAPYGTG